MNFLDLIIFIGKNKIQLRNHNGKLCYDSPGTIPQPIIHSLMEYKDVLLKTLGRFNDNWITMFPLSYNQQSLWFSHNVAPESFSYNVAIPVRIRGPLNLSRFRFSLEQIIKRFDQLRAVFDLPADSSQSVPCQFITDSVLPDLTCIDGSSWSELQCEDTINSFYRKPFQIASKPPFRVIIISKSPIDHIISFCFHHIIFDAFSGGIFLKNFEQVYLSSDSFNTKTTSSYSDFVFSQLDYISHYGNQDLEFWKKCLNKKDTCTLAADYEGKAGLRNNGSTFYFKLDNQSVDRIRSLAKSLSITPFSIYMGSFQLLHMKRSGSFQSIIGVLTHGRFPGNIQTFGYFVNPLPLTSLRVPSESIKKHLQTTHQDILQLQDRMLYPFSLLVENLSPARGVSNVVFFGELFNMLSRKQLGVGTDLFYATDKTKNIKFCNIDASPFPLNQQEGQFNLTMELLEESDFTTGIIKYKNDFFNDESISKIASLYCSILHRIPDLCNQSIEEFFDTLDPCKTDTTNTKLDLTITSTFTSDLIQKTFDFWSRMLSFSFNCTFTPYNQFFHQLSNLTHTLSPNEGFNILLIRLEDFCNFYYEKNIETTVILQRIDEMCTLISRAVENQKVKFIIVFCPCSSELIEKKEYLDFFANTEESTISRLNSLHGVFCISSVQLLMTYKIEYGYEPVSGIIGHSPYTDEFLAVMGTMIIRTINNVYKNPCKVIIVDCDNTLWAGVAGEDSIEQISIPEPMRSLQIFLKTKRESGVLLGLCSRNNKEDIMDVFQRHPEMILRHDDFSFYKINWNSKSTNITELLLEANLSSNGVFFIDDNPAECAEVRANCPGITTIQLPSILKNRPSFINHFWAMDTLKTTTEDHDRTQKYRQESERKIFREQTVSFADFIDGLNLNIIIRKSQKDDAGRISQLSFRTNQFTLSKTAFTEDRVLVLMEISDLFVVEVEDRFGKYGLVGVIDILYNNKVPIVDTFLLSCRALCRGVEYKMLSFIGNYAECRQFERINFEVVITQKNDPLRLFFDRVIGDYLSNESNTSLLYTVPSSYLVKIHFSPESIPVSKSIVAGQTNKALPSGKELYITDGVYNKIAESLSEVHSLVSAVYPNYYKKSILSKSCSKNSDGDFVTTNITEIFCNVLGVNAISQNENFFDIGGKSILIPSLISQINSRLKITVSIIDIFQFPTILTLSDHIQKSKTFA